MKRRKAVTLWGIPLLSWYLIRDITFAGWELSNLFSFLFILFCLYLIFITLR